LWDKHGRLTNDARELILETYLSGPSTRRVGEVLDRVLKYRVSAQTVSSICKGLDEQVRRYWRSEIGDHWQYLILDGIVVKSRSAVGAEKRVILVALGVSTSGRKEILSFRQVESESEVCATSFVEDLYRRGLVGEHLKQITTDGSPGLIAAVESMWPQVARQRCWVHKLRNVSNKTRRSNQKACLDEAKQIYLAANRKQAVQHFRTWYGKWEVKEPKAVQCLTRDIEDMLVFFELPKQDQVMMRTTNPIERVFREVRRRIRTMSCFTNRRSVDRMLYAVLSYQNRQWERAYPPGHFTHNT
jgi:putative transposase